MIRDQETIPTVLSRVMDYKSYPLLHTMQMIVLQKAQCTHDIKERVVKRCSKLKNFIEENRLRNWPS